MNKKYKVRLAGHEIGETMLESADPPMGVVSGRIIFNGVKSGYDLFKTHCTAKGVAINNDFPKDKFIDTQHIHDLEVISDDGAAILGQASAVTGFDEEGFEVQIFGIPYPFYEEQFPDHVKQYQEKFK